MPPANTQSVQPQMSNEAKALLEKINAASHMPPGLREKALFMLNRVDKLIKGSNYKEYESIENYINWITKLPYRMYTQDNLDFQSVNSFLDELHYGLDDIKDKVLEFLSVMKLQLSQEGNQLGGQGGNRAPVLLFLGIQGVGKTTMAKSIAKSLGRRFVRIALGGMGSVHELRGMTRGFPESEPGQIVKALIRSESMNPVILLDELDKVSETGGTRQDIMASLLEVLDPEQNYAFSDRYVDFPLDISRCLFITTANNTGGISAALLDRMEIVRFTSYSDEDKAAIAKTYLLPKIRKATGLGEETLQFSDDVWPLIIRPLGFDAGIRQLERTLTNLARKVAKQIVQGEGDTYVISAENFRQYIPDDFGVYT